MENVNQTVNTVYSKINKVNNNIQYKQYSSSRIQLIFKSLSDLIPDDGYGGFYVNKFKEVGYERFMELAQKARAGSDTPARLFCWMLKNNSIVR